MNLNIEIKQKDDIMTRFFVDPRKGFESVGKRVNEFINEAEKGFGVEYGGYAPRVDILEDDKTIVFEFEMAGIDKSDVKVSVNDENVLIVRGEKKAANDEELCATRCERQYGTFLRSFLLPENADKEKIDAKFENGVLFVTFDKVEPEEPKEIKVEIK